MNANEYLTEVEARADAATDGPWEVLGRRVVLERGEGPVLITPHLHVAEDAEFIAHSRTDVPRMTAALRAVLDITDDHWSWITRKPGRENDCVCEVCRIRRAITERLGVDE